MRIVVTSFSVDEEGLDIVGVIEPLDVEFEHHIDRETSYAADEYGVWAHYMEPMFLFLGALLMREDYVGEGF